MELKEQRPTTLRLSELLAAISLVTDLGMRQPPEAAMRACLLATALARQRNLPESDVVAVFYTTLLRYLGCTAYASEEARIFGGDDISLRVEGALVDQGNAREMLPFLLFRPGRGLPLPQRVMVVARGLFEAEEFGRQLSASHCEVALQLARRLGLPESVQLGVYQLMEQWNGKGGPDGLSGEEVSVASRYALLANRYMLFRHELGPETALTVVGNWSGTVFDPELVDTLLRNSDELLAQAARDDVLEAVLDCEPRPHLEVSEDRLDTVSRALADMVELKVHFLRGHSHEVARLAEAAALRMGMSDSEAKALRIAGYLHDIGRIGIANGIWEKRARPSTGEWEQIRLHAYHGERILSRAPAFRHLAELVGAHHERLDGSGYHRQAKAGQITPEACLLAAADAFQAMTQERPYRPALDVDEAAAGLRAEVRAGRLDGEAVQAVLSTAGYTAVEVKREWPAGLSDREVEVLRLLARGNPNKRMASELGISAKTVDHHVQHIYDKLGVSTRAAATMFAMEQGLVR